MIAIIPFVYLWSIPALIIFSVVANNLQNRLYSKYVLQVMNFLMVIYAIYQIRLLIGLMQFFRSMNQPTTASYNWISQFGDAILQTLLTILLPLIFLVPWARRNSWISLGVMFFYLNIIDMPDWDVFNWVLGIGYFISWFTFIYGLFWLIKWLRQ